MRLNPYGRFWRTSMAALAQSVEPWFVVPVVMGSSPIGRPGMKITKNFLKEFETFALRGNAIDLAVGVIIGAAFNQVTTAFANDVLTPPLGLLINNVNFSELVIPLGGTATIYYGIFLQTILNFIITAFALFLVVKVINRVRLVSGAVPDTKDQKQKTQSDQETVLLLREIRDRLPVQHTPNE